MRISFVSCVAAIALALALCAVPCSAQSTNAAVGGQITDEQGRVVPGVTVVLTNLNTGVTYEAKTNGDGFYSAPNLPPGIYRANVTKGGFKNIVKGDIELHVQDVASINFQLQIGSVTETVTVQAGGMVINTQDATVSIVVDRQFAENLPLNGRSFQTLIQLTPGVVLTQYNNKDTGQFSVNGQRPSANYWTVDGVGANVGIGTSNASAGNGLGGANAATSALGGTNSLVSVDAMQEFRIQTSTFAPEFGRTPGAQVSIVTRSGTNQFHGTAFDYLRNDVFDAKNWFAGLTNPPLPKPKERQNDFGGTFSGAILRDRTFFFFSYEGLRLRLPQVALEPVPDMNARQTAVPALLPFLNAFPLPTPGSPDNVATGVGQFNASYSNSASLDATSFRIDHRAGDRLSLFGRYNYSPSMVAQRGGTALSSLSTPETTLQTVTGGATWAISSSLVNDLRFNYSRTDSKSRAQLDNFGDAVAPTSFPLPAGFDTVTGRFFLGINSLSPFVGLDQGIQGHNIQRQVNLVEGFTAQKGAHNVKLGVDFRRLSPFYGNTTYFQQLTFTGVPSATSTNLLFGAISAGSGASYLFHNLGVYAQDSWRISERLTVTYGLRWDVDFAPSSNPAFLAVVGFNLNDLSNLALAPSGTPPFETTYGNVAPRIGLAYRLRGNQSWQTVIRGGFGVFYDLASSEAGNSINSNRFPFGATKFVGPAAPGGGSSAFPLSTADAAPPAITAANLATFAAGGVFDPNLKLPYSLEWNVAFEQALGAHQALSASYVGSVGRRLLQTGTVVRPNATFAGVNLITNSATSDYDALEVQFRRRLSSGLQALASYTWSHSIDTGSAGSIAVGQNVLTSFGANANRGPSDFDIRNAFSAGVTYDIPAPFSNALMRTLIHGWSLENVAQARSAPPITPVLSFSTLSFFSAQIRPNVNPGVPVYLFGSQCLLAPPTGLGRPCPGGKGLNPNAFSVPPAGQQGDLPRNALRAFGAWQWDSAVHRDFPIRENLKVQFRAEVFNILNHPNFAPPVATVGSSQFGVSTQTLGSYLAGLNIGNGAFNPLYQIGGPRSLQFGLKVQF